MNPNQISMLLNTEKEIQTRWLQLHTIIIDRKSKYSVTAGKIIDKLELQEFLKKLKSDKKYRKATHNSYAGRINVNGKIISFKNDDGETGAGITILREIQRYNIINIIVVVTRWYGGIKLYSDRFKHIKIATQLIFKETNKK